MTLLLQRQQLGGDVTACVTLRHSEHFGASIRPNCWLALRISFTRPLLSVDVSVYLSVSVCRQLWC